MRSDTIKRGYERAPHRSLLKATGNYRDEDIDKPFIANSDVDIIPGHAHLDAVGQYVKKCVREAGGVPFLFNTIGADDGIAMRLGEIARGTEGLLDPNRRTVTGKTLGENIAEYDIREKGERIQTVGLSSVRSGELATSEWAGKLNRAALRRMSDAEASEHQGAAVLEAIRSEAFDPLDCIRSVDEAELDQRRSAPLSEPLKLRGYLARYASRVTPASKGAVLKQ